MLRAELDGLAVEEETGVSFAARNGAMHACGHDVHMAALVAVTRTAARAGPEVPLVALFQPSEETYPSGARRIVEEGALQPHHPKAVVGVHLHPDVPWGSMAVEGGPVNAATDKVELVVEGIGGHGAYPHRSADPILAISQVVVSLQQVASRRADPLHSVVLSFGSVRAGSSSENVIPRRAEATGILRTLQPQDREGLRRAVREIAEHTARAHACTAEICFTEGEPALVNDPGLAARVRGALPAVGLESWSPLRSCGSDDFGFYQEVAPILMSFLGLAGHPDDPGVPLHHPRFFPPDEAVAMAARGLVAAYAGAAGLEEPR